MDTALQQWWPALLAYFRRNTTSDNDPAISLYLLINSPQKFPYYHKLNLFNIGMSSKMSRSSRRRKHAVSQLNLMVVGFSSLGKTSFIRMLFDTLRRLKEDIELPASLSKRAETAQDAEAARTKELCSFTLDIEEEGEKISLTLVDCPGFVRDNELRLDVQVTEETKVKRNPKAQDSQIHACLYFIDNTNNGLTDKDIRILKRLTARVNVIPIVAKADLLTTTQLANLKKAINRDIKQYQIPTQIPFSIIAPEDAELIDPSTSEKILGRQYAWGVIDCLNPKHCDFVVLRNVLLSSHRKLFKDITLELFYEQYRTERLMARKA
ncbi:4118_t:CDS:2, partial [Racocetra persica]